MVSPPYINILSKFRYYYNDIIFLIAILWRGLGTINSNILINGIAQGIFAGIVIFFIMYPIEKKNKLIWKDYVMENFVLLINHEAMEVDGGGLLGAFLFGATFFWSLIKIIN